MTSSTKRHRFVVKGLRAEHFKRYIALTSKDIDRFRKTHKYLFFVFVVTLQLKPTLLNNLNEKNDRIITFSHPVSAR